MKEKLWTVLAIVIIISLGLAACGPTPTPVPPTNTPMPVPPTDTPVPTTPAEEELPTITIGLGGEALTTIDPTSFPGANVTAITMNVFETLISFDENDKIVPWLAESWEWSDDGLTLTMNLRQDVVFSDGNPMTCADVLFSIEREAVNNMAVGAQLNPDQGYAGSECADDYTFVVNYSAPSAQFMGQTLGMGLYVVSKTQFETVGEDEFMMNPIGTGPYKISGWKEGQYIDLVPNELYWGEPAKFSLAHFVPAPDEAGRIGMLQAGEVDLITQVSGVNAPALEEAGFNRIDIPQAHDIVLIFDLVNPNHPWSDLKVRQAIDYAIDQDAVIETIFNGQHLPAVWLKDTELGYIPEFGEAALGYDIEEAQRLMGEAGYADGFEMPVTYAAWMEWSTTLLDYITAQLELINITVVPTGLTDFMEFMGAMEQWHPAHTEGGDVFLFDVGWPGNPDPSINLTNGFYSGKPNSLYFTDELDALVEQIIETIDDEARAPLIAQAYQIIKAAHPVIPICLEVATSMSAANVTYTKSYGGMGAGPTRLCDLTKE
jgi:peptide/nickel transport system substrate-binding protein